MSAEYATFEHFARDVFLHAMHFRMLVDTESYDPIVLTEEASFVSTLLADGHSEHFHPIFARTEKVVLQTDEQFLKYTIPRCLKLIDKDKYFYSMMLVASFLQELLNYLRDKRLCYRFYFTAYKCLAAVFERTFKDSFESKGGWKGLGTYLKDFVKKYYLIKEKLIISALNDGGVDLIKNCDNISEDFNLNEYEISLLKDMDVKDLEESLDYNEADKDPLNMSWPPEDFDGSSPSSSPSSDYDDDADMASSSQLASDPNSGKDMEGSSAPSKDLNGEKDIDDSKNKSCDRGYRIVLADGIEAEMLGTDEFLEKFKLRTCPCCGTKCCQFAYKLFGKQLDLALKDELEF